MGEAADNKSSKPSDQKLKETDPVKKIFHEIPRGLPKSGRKWKSVRTERHSTIKNVKRFRTTWAEKMAKRDEKRQTKEWEQRIKEEKAKQKQLKRERTEANRKRKLENQRKAEIVQPIKDTRKIKKMRKKQLRQIETR